ncbi:hypothetical protein [uncultured Cohaesibacter sp.]|nr:hypothetical protein [uncultured Cohaesibacter sp.]
MQKEQNEYIIGEKREQNGDAVMIIRDVLALGSLITFMTMIGVWAQVLV